VQVMPSWKGNSLGTKAAPTTLMVDRRRKLQYLLSEKSLMPKPPRPPKAKAKPKRAQRVRKPKLKKKQEKLGKSMSDDDDEHDDPDMPTLVIDAQVEALGACRHSVCDASP